MMRRITTLFWLACALLAAACTALPPADPAPLIGDADRAQMQAALGASADAWNRGDLPAHLLIYDESITAMTKSGPRPTIAAIEKSFRAAYFSADKPRQDLRMEQVVIRALSDRSALMTGRFVLSGAGQAEQSGWFTLIWLRTGGGWKVVHDHSS